MEEKNKKGKSIVADENKDGDNSYPQELRDLGVASLTIAGIRFMQFEDDTLSEIQYMKSKFLGDQDQKGDQEPSSPHLNLDKFKAKEIDLNNNPSSRKPTRGQKLGQEPHKNHPPSEPQVSQMIREYHPPLIPPVPHDLYERIDKSKLSEPYEKHLTFGDMCWLTIHSKHVEAYVLPLLEGKEDIKKGVNITVYDIGSGREYIMCLKHWSDKLYTLNRTGWLDFLNDHPELVKENKSDTELKYEDFVKLWFFRDLMTGGLSCLISCRRTKHTKKMKLNKKD